MRRHRKRDDYTVEYRYNGGRDIESDDCDDRDDSFWKSIFWWWFLGGF